jgi:hypothetical protein
LLVGRSVTAQAPSNNNNIGTPSSSSTLALLPTIRTLAGTLAPIKTQNQKKFVAFNIKQQRVVFLELICKD